MAVAKAYGVLGLGMDSRAIAARAADSAEFFTSAAALAGGLFSVPGGVFVHDDAGTLLGAAGASGDASLADEEAVVAGIRAAGLTPAPARRVAQPRAVRLLAGIALSAGRTSQ